LRSTQYDIHYEETSFSKNIPARHRRNDRLAFPRVHAAGANSVGRRDTENTPELHLLSALGDDGQVAAATTGIRLRIYSDSEPLEPYRDYLNVVSNTFAPLAYGADASAAANHARSSAVFLSGAKPDEGARPSLGVTVDQVAAKAIGQETPLPSIELTVEEGGLTSPFRNTISWQTPTSPLPMEHNPQVIFEKLFGDGSNEAERAARRQQSRSLLDSVMEQVASLNNQLPAGDRGRLAGYLDDVREIERRIHKSEDQMRTAQLKVPDTPTSAPAAFEERIKMLFDLQILAFRADITRIST
jgi:hypothetical protein